VVSPHFIRAGSFVKVTGLDPIQNTISEFDQSTGFIVSETNYDDSTGVITLSPEGTDQTVSIMLARMGL
jgi:hypothetical protein